MGSWAGLRVQCPAGNNRQSSNRNPLDFVERAGVVEFGRPRRFVVRDLLRDFEFTAVL